MANLKSLQANKKTLKQLKDLMNDLGQNISIKVGILQPKGSQSVEGTDLSLADLGAVHEFGANIEHPGGTPYFINNTTGKAVFVKKDSIYGKLLIARGQVTKPHTINLPARPFLRPLLNKENKDLLLDAAVLADDTELNALFGADELAKNPKYLEDMAERIAVTAVDIVRLEFQGDKIKPPTKPSSKKQRKGYKNLPAQPDNPTLMNTGELQKSISYEVKKVN